MKRTFTGVSIAALGALLLVAVQPAHGKTAANESVTLTGCLRADGAKYRLTDLHGNQAPKGRSWKTAFITKNTKDVEIVSTSAGPKLKEHVGKVVTLVGVRKGETHMQAKSIKQIGASCS
jgi:hypothetical protein